jgi:hypothetical protein
MRFCLKVVEAITRRIAVHLESLRVREPEMAGLPPVRLTPPVDSVPMRAVKFFLPLVVLLACGLSACNTVENRRSLYSPARANGPYTRSLQDGSWRDRTAKPVDQEYAEAKKKKKQSRPVAPVTKPAAAHAPVSAPLPEN